MNILDIILIIPLAWFAYRGFTRGFIIELASLVARIAGIWAARHFSFCAADCLAGNVDMGPKYRPLVAVSSTVVAGGVGV